MPLEPDPFLGTWELDPATLDYQHGCPGRRAIYKIEPAAEGLTFILDADDADGKQLNFTYGGSLDGRDQPLPGTDAILILTRYDQNNIESTLKRGGKSSIAGPAKFYRTATPCSSSSMGSSLTARLSEIPASVTGSSKARWAYPLARKRRHGCYSRVYLTGVLLTLCVNHQ
jgi:hypothetical protein